MHSLALKTDERSTDLAQFRALLAQRHSCRAFLPKPLPRDLVMELVRTAGQSASWCNAQPWQVHIVSGAALEALRQDLIDKARTNAAPAPELDWPLEYRGLYQERRRECGWALYRAVGVENGDREGSTRQTRENFRLFGAPHLAIVTSEAILGSHGVMDCGAWVSNFLLAACASGIGSIAQAAVAGWPDVLHEHLDIGADKHIVCGISFGYEDVAHPANSFRTTRAQLVETAIFVG